MSVEDLQILDVLLTERSLTRTAQALQISQPAVSKALAKLRRRFGDPLLLRVGATMELTQRALALQRALREVLLAMRRLDEPADEFDPARSERTFRLFISDVGIARLLPRLVQVLESQAPGVLLDAVHVDPERLHAKLEAGDLDLAVGPFPALTRTIRRQRLNTEGYVSVVRPGHPRLGPNPTFSAFCAERHVIIAAHTATFVHRDLERALLGALPPRNIVLRVPGFIEAAMVARHTDAVTTLPSRIAEMLATEFGLQLVRPPLPLPRLPIGLYWHERAHRDAGNKWMRALFYRLFSESARTAASRT